MKTNVTKTMDMDIDMAERAAAARLLIFDLDGTLLDTLDDLTAAVNFALRRHGLPERERRQIQDFVGDGVKKLVQRALPPEAGEELRQQVFADFAARYGEHCADLTRPYDGVTGLLRQLKQQGKLTAVVSNKSHREVQALCDRFFPGLLDLVAGERPGLARKPAPDLPLLVLRELGCTPEQALYIGDSQVDVATAAAAGLACVSVSWGFRSREQLLAAGARQVADTPRQLLALLTAPGAK